MAYSLTNTTKKKSSSSSSSGSSGNSSNSVTVTASQRAANKKGGSVSSGSSDSSGGKTSGGSSSGGIKYDPNKDYAAEIQKAVQNGASQSVIDSLNAQRDAKIKGENLSYSSLTDSDIANYRNQTTVNSGNYVVGQDGGSRYTYNPDDEYISSLSQSLRYDPNNLRGYSDPSGYYTTRQNAFVWEQPDGTKKTTYSNATNYHQALADAIAAGQLSDGAKLVRADTYGTGSLTGDSYNYGVTSTGTGGFSGFGNGYEGGRYTSDNQYGNMYDQTNMQYAFLSGRDGNGTDGNMQSYINPYADLAYQGNGMTNAYNKGTGFAGQGGIMGGYGVEGPNMDDIYANYGTANSGYVGLTKEDIEAQMNDAYEGYMDAVNQRNDALAAAYAAQIEELRQAAEEEQRANYINYKLAGLNMPAQMQAAGINGGIAESTLAGLESDYMKNYNSTAGNLTNAVNQLKIAQNNAIAEGNMEAANMYAQLAQNSLSLQMQAAQAENAYNQWVQEMAFARNQWEAEQARYNAELEYNRMLSAQAAQAEERERLIQYAQTAGDWDLYASLTGTDTSYMRALQDYELSQLNPSSRSVLGYSSGGSGGSSGGSYQDTIDSILDNNTNPTLKVGFTPGPIFDLL